MTVMKYCYLLMLPLLALTSCKKDEEDNNSGSNGGGTTVTPTEISVTITVNGETQEFVFGENGYNMQFSSAAYDMGGTFIVAPSTALVYGGGAGTEYAGYFSVSLPGREMNESEWTADPAATFIEYFTEDSPLAGPIPSLTYASQSGYTWVNTGNNDMVDWVKSYEVEETGSPAMVRCHG
ncbi:MAG: hypothetical protein RL220_1583, partial [Bacteroidota bacterium]